MSDIDYSEFIEVDPTGRYGRYNEILGKGASKTVYRGFDEYEGIEVAWNQVKLNAFMRSPGDLEMLYCEIHLLKTMKHANIIKFYTSWVDTANRNINFVTELFTSGTLRQYRLKHRRVNIRAVKNWCRQILKGLLYLHSCDPPVIHRDLKCDNIFVNGNQGEVKIGDLGLAAILRKSNAAHCVGTPEFMAPEVYEEEYNELVDIYSFGMCILEMVTFEYPYSECTHPAQIYKKVISGKKPEALYKVKDAELRIFVEKCLATASLRLSALQLLNDPFLQPDKYGYDLRSMEYQREFNDLNPFIRHPLYNVYINDNSMINGYYEDYKCFEPDDSNYEPLEFDLFTCHEDEHLEDVEISIRGKRREDDGIFLRFRIADKEGPIRNIYFPFDTEQDTALTVATEMVAELDMTDHDVTKIAEMIDNEISTLVPEWRTSENIDEPKNCASNKTIMGYTSPQGCGAAMHGRFEEITYQVDASSEQCNTEGAPVVSSELDGLHFADIWGQHDGPELSSHGSGEVHSVNQSKFKRDECSTFSDDYENEVRQELRWLKAKYQMQLRDQRLAVQSKSLCLISPKSCSPEQIMVTARSFYAGALLPQSLHRASSLPVDAIDF